MNLIRLADRPTDHKKGAVGPFLRRTIRRDDYSPGSMAFMLKRIRPCLSTSKTLTRT
jgi:hypothetical protein